MAPVTVIFTVLGVPAPQGSKTAFRVGDRAVVAEGGSSTGRAKHRAWRDAVGYEARAQGVTFSEPVIVDLYFTFPRPKSDPYRTRHTVKPDLDKLVRSTLDGLTAGGLLADDSLVFSLTARKEYSTNGPGCVVEVTGLGGNEALDRDRLKAAAKAARKVA